MSLAFGHDDLEPNHIHDIKPLIALSYYQLITRNFQFIYKSGINYNVWRYPEVEMSHVPKRDIITDGWIEEKNSQLEFLAHTFDSDSVIGELTMRYDLICLMRDGTTEYKLIDEFDLMPFKITSGMIESINHFLFNGKKIYYISDIQPNSKNMLKMSIHSKRINQYSSSMNNESLLEVLILHTQLMKPMNDIMLQTL